MSSSTPEPYDVNFCFPVPEALENERVLLTPFIPTKHAEPFISQALLAPEIFTYLPFGPFTDTQDFINTLLEGRIQKDAGYVLLAVYDSTKPPTRPDEPGVLAGAIGLINSSVDHLCTEIGCVMILPAFQRTHIASNAVGLLLHYTLDVPSLESPLITVKGPTKKGLGLRRVCWQANALNKPSIRLAERMGFRMEGLLRWAMVLKPEKGSAGAGNGRQAREGDPMKESAGRDTALLSLCWDDWEGGGREVVDKVMARVK